MSNSWSKYQSDLSLTGDSPTLCCAQGSPKRLGWPTSKRLSHHRPGTQLSHNAAALILGKFEITTEIIQRLGCCNTFFCCVNPKTPHLGSMKWLGFLLAWCWNLFSPNPVRWEATLKPSRPFNLTNHTPKMKIVMSPKHCWEANVKALWVNIENGKWEATLDCFKLRVWIWLALQRRALSGSGEMLNASSDKPWATSGGRSHRCPPTVYSTSPEASTRCKASFKLMTTESLPFSWRSAWQLAGMGEQTKGAKIFTNHVLWVKIEGFGMGDYHKPRGWRFISSYHHQILWRLKDLGWVTITNHGDEESL